MSNPVDPQPVTAPAVITYDSVIQDVGATRSKVVGDNAAVAARKAVYELANADLASGYAADSAALTTTLTTDQADAAQADATLKAVVAAAGGIAVVNGDGTATAYETDGAGGYITKTLKLSTQPVPAVV